MFSPFRRGVSKRTGAASDVPLNCLRQAPEHTVALICSGWCWLSICVPIAAAQRMQTPARSDLFVRKGAAKPDISSADARVESTPGIDERQ